MGQRIGIIAGGGRFVPAAIRDFQKRGLTCVVAAIEREASRQIVRTASVFQWVSLGEPLKAVSFFRENQADGVMLLGKVRPSAVYRAENFSRDSQRLLEGLPDQSATVILRAAVAFLESHGIRVLDPGPFFEPYLCEPGLLTKTGLSASAEADIDFGLPLARRLADLDIAQTLVVRRRTVVAVEGPEGTDAAVRRGAKFAGPGFSVAKAGRTVQDMRLDVPAVGLDTIRAIVKAGGAALGLDAAKVAFFQRREAVALADSRGLAIVARPAAGPGEAAVG
jgi:UDP-2,3-diacylglucosamine hydrolase